MRVLCISAYELGQQPLGAAGPASLLAAAGHDVETADLSVESWPAGAVASAEAVVFSVPMHTATELCLKAAKRIEESGRRPLFAFSGLYAGVLAGHPLLQKDDLLCAGETGAALLSWLERIADKASLADRAARAGEEVLVDLGPSRLAPSPPPARELLPPLESYARYLFRGESFLSAGLEASRGCNHRCRHCPVAALYGGRSRPLDVTSVLADVDQVVEMGAEHLSFSDPDFLNRPRHAMAVAEAVHSRHPGLSFDATVKVEHILRHRALIEPLARAGLSFLVSAFESTDDVVLGLLDKGHVVAEEKTAVAICRSVGVDLRPSWLPFSPWTTLSSLASLLELSATTDLVGSTDPVQYSIRLLLPKGSLLVGLDDPVLDRAVEAARSGLSSWQGSLPWRHAEPAIDELQKQMASRVEAEAASERPFEETFAALWSLARQAGVPLRSEPSEPDPSFSYPLASPERPRLSEAWFCCAEPTSAQMEVVAG